MTRTMFTLAIAVVAATLVNSADPPVAKPPEKVVDGGKKEEPKRPTTKEEFAALAKEGPKPPWMPFGRGHKMVAEDIIDGTVVDVSRESIEIQLKGKKESAKYPPHTLLDTGAVCHWQFDSHCYLLDDVKKGDVVVLSVGTVDKDKGPECFWLRIRERPGGVVPASRKPSFPKAYHLEQQKEIEDARNGIPPKVKPLEPPPPKAGEPPPAGDPKKKD